MFNDTIFLWQHDIANKIGSYSTDAAKCKIKYNNLYFITNI